MFSKSIFIFGLLALFACQGETATLGDMIDQLKEVIASLNKLVNGTIGDALGTLGNLATTIAQLEKTFLDQGVTAITGEIENVVEFIRNKTQEAAELGIDIETCIVGRDKQLQELGTGLNANLSDCVTTTVESVRTMVNNEIKDVRQIVSKITAIPVNLSKCLISLRPITCVTNLLKQTTSLTTSLPGQIAGIVDNALALVENLPTQLSGCVANTASSTISQTEAIYKEIETCVDGLISGGAGNTTSTTATTTTTTVASTTA